jgi:hypothetical protein
MSWDVQLGLITFVMAVLGGVVSAVALPVRWHKFVFSTAFLLLGCWGMYVVVRQSRESAASASKLDSAIGRIHDSTTQIEKDDHEIARVEALNTELQTRLLNQSQTIASLAKQSVSELTGGDTFPYFVAVPNAGSGNPTTFPLMVFVRGKCPMREVSTAVQRSGQFAISENLTQPLLPLPSTLLPGVSPVNYRVGFGRYSFQTWCVGGGPINEVLDMQASNDGQLHQEVEVWGWGKRLYKEGTEDLGFAPPKKSSH